MKPEQRRVQELEGEVRRLKTFIGESVLPMEFVDGARISAVSISGGADYIDGWPRQLTLLHIDTDGAETTRVYVQEHEGDLKAVFRWNA